MPTTTCIHNQDNITVIIHTAGEIAQIKRNMRYLFQKRDVPEMVKIWSQVFMVSETHARGELHQDLRY